MGIIIGIIVTTLLLFFIVFIFKKIKCAILSTDWDTYFVCDCGNRCTASFGDQIFIHYEICPNCGKSKSTRRKTIGRYENGKFVELEDKG